MADDIGFVPSKPDVGFVPGIQAQGADIGFVPSKPDSLADKSKDIIHEYYNPPQDTKPYPQWFESALENTYHYAIAPFNKAGAKGTELARDYFEAMYGMGDKPVGGPSQLTPEGRIPEQERSVVSGVMSGIGGTLGGAVADPRNWPFFGKAALSPIFEKLMSAGFATQMGAGTIQNLSNLINNWDNLTPPDRAEGLTSTGLGALMTTIAAHGAMAGHPDNLSIQDRADLHDIVNNHLEQSVKTGDLQGVQDAHDVSRELIKTPGDRLLANISAIADKLEERKNDRTNIRPSATEAETNPITQQGANTTGPIPTSPSQIEQPTQTPLIAEENLRDNSGNTGGEGTTGAAASTGPVNTGDEGPASQGILDASLDQLKAIYPQYAHIIGGGEGTAPASLEQPSREVTLGATEEPEGAGAPAPPVISRVIDNDMAETGGIHIVEKGKDISLLSRWLGGLAETARQLNNSGHPLGPILTSIAAKMSDVSKAIVQNQMDTMADYVSGAKKYVSRDEWSNKVVPLLDNPEITPDNIPADTPSNIKQAYLKSREILDRQRMGIIQAKRQELLNRGISPEKAAEWVPDDWGKQTGYYHHAFPGTWVISKLVDVDERGNETYELIETGWRAESRNEANDKAIQYLKDNPSAQIRIQQDTVTLPGKNLADRQRLMDLTKEIKEAGETVVRGGDPEDILKQLYADAGAKAFGPRQIASRQLAAALPRKSNLAGFATDRDNFEASLLATERYIQLAPARQLLMKARNAIANLAGMPAAQRMSEFPSLVDYWSAKQYGNILARVDSAIEGLEGKPGATDAAIRYTLNQLGWDPNTINNIYKPIQSIMALVKLGFNPARVLSHGLQSLWGVYPVLGEVDTLRGMAHSYDSHYDSLIKDLGITHGVNATEIEGIRSYAGNYFGHGSTPIDWAKGTGSILRDVGLFPFTTGIEFTRRTAAIGAFLQGIDRGYTPEGARNYARDVMDRTTGNYTPSDNASFLRQLPGPVSQFKNFMLKTMQFTTGLRGPEIARFMAAIGVIGFTGFPMLRSLLNLAYNITGEDVETDIKRKFPIASRGVFGLLGMDVPSGVGLGDLSISRDKTPLGGLGGPALSDAIAMGNALAQKVIKGPSREAQDTLDTAIRNISPEARRVYDEATRLSTGRPYLIDPRTGAVILSDLSTQERAELLAGITPLRVARERDAHEYIRNQVEQAKDKRGFFVDRLAELQVNLTQPNLSEADRMEILRQTSAYIQQAQDYGLSHQLTRAVLQRAKEMQLERLSRDIKLAPKPQRLGAYQEQQRFKGEQ